MSIAPLISVFDDVVTRRLEDTDLVVLLGECRLAGKLAKSLQCRLCQCAGQRLGRHFFTQRCRLTRPVWRELTAALLLRLSPQRRQGQHPRREVWRHLMKLAELPGQPIRESACRASGKDVCQYRRVRTRLSQRVTIKRRDRSLRTEEVSGPDLDPRGAERKGSRDPTSVSDPARGDNRHADGIDDLWHQRQRARLRRSLLLQVCCEEHAAVAAGFAALGNNDIGATRLQPTRLGDCRCRRQYATTS